MAFCKNSYIPFYVKPDLKWYERDGLITYIDRLKYERFEKNRDMYFTNVLVINFDIINNQIKKTPLKKSIKEYKTIKNEKLNNMPPDDRDAAIAAALRCERTDLQVCKKVRDEYFKTWEDSKKFVKHKKDLEKKNQRYFDCS